MLIKVLIFRSRYIWHNRDGMADHDNRGNGSEWTRHSISYHHNLLWQGEPLYKFDERVNHSNIFESQACKSGGVRL